MARSGKTAQEFIQSSFSPIVATLCSPKVDNIVSKNNLTLPELLQPFTALEWEGQLREPGGSQCTIKNWRLIIRDVHWKPLQPTEARRQLNNAVLHNYSDKMVTLELEGLKIDIPQSTHWFDAWRETYLEVQFPSDHEFTKHFISCIIVGAAHEDNIIDTFNALNQQYAQLQNVAPPKLPKWFNTGVLKTYLLLHDTSIMPKDRADATFETLKQNFGATNCFMLTINSKTSVDSNVATDYWAQFVKRTLETNVNSEMSSSMSHLQTTVSEPQPELPPSTVNVTVEDGNSSTTAVQDNMHPLTSPDNDIYDNANSLQTHSFSGSIESVNVAGKGIDATTEVHGVALNSSDIDAIKKFLQDYASKALLPYLEKQIAQLSELVANRKGVSRSLLSATKRWFGTGKSGNTTGNSTVVYTSDCPELQLRRLGDLWFMCGQWQRAFDTYHTAKREFYADSAWLCYAGALEMAALSAFMAGDANRKTHGYMEESIVTYLNTCRMVQYAVRATLVSAVCLRGGGPAGEAARQLIRMTAEDSDLRSAMLLEQAALCFLSRPAARPMPRKYAFHMVLAGHRFSKAGQKKHAYRCYKQAYQVYEGRGWRLATDHVQFALGRLAGALRLGSAALRWLAAPLAPPSPQPAAQQDAFLREYTLAHQQWMESGEEGVAPELPLPVAQLKATRVVCVGPAPLAAPRRKAASSLGPASLAQDARAVASLEEALLLLAQGSLPLLFKPTVDLYTEETDAEPIVPQGEPIQISVTLWNPLKISLVLRDVELLWRFVAAEGETVDNEPAVTAGRALHTTLIANHKIPSLLLEGDCKKVLNFTLTPLHIGRLNIHGLAYKLINAGEGGNENSTGVIISGKINLVSGVKNTDKRLQITVIPEAPCLQMTFSETNPEFISGEMRTIDVEFTNVGPVDMSNLYVAVSHPDCISLLTGEDTNPFKVLYEDKYRDPPDHSEERAGRAEAARAAAARRGVLVSRTLARGAVLRVPLLLRPRVGSSAPYVLAYYETGLPARPYRLLRHQFRFTITEAVELSVTPRRSLATVGEDVMESMSLAVEVKNVFKEKEDDCVVEILEASLLSRQWKLNAVTAARLENSLLNSRERLHLVLKARRLIDTLPEGRVEYSCIKIVKGHHDSEADINVPPYSKFILDSKSTNSDIPDLLDNSENNSKTKKSGLIQSMFVLRWRARSKMSDRVAIGQHCLWLDCFTKALTHEEVTPLPLDVYDSQTDIRDSNDPNRKDNVVILKLDHCDHITHDFKQNKICLVPVTINVVNCYGIPVKVSIDMTSKKNSECGAQLGWAGALGGGDGEGFVKLARWEARRLSARAVCAAPGTYVLGSSFTVSAAADQHHHLNVANASDNTTSLLVVRAL